MISQTLKEKYYADTKYDGTSLFGGWLRSFASPEAKVLNLGGPATNSNTCSLKGEVAEVVGADIDPAVLFNSGLDRAAVISGGKLDFDSGYFDIVYSDYVLEHVEKPLEFLSEVHRVLKPGCSFFFRTPNVFHYVGIISAVTPHGFHEALANLVRGYDEGAHEPWPAFYRMNSRPVLKRLAKATGFHEVELRMIECNPAYLEFHALPFYLGVGYERLVNSHRIFSGMRANILGRFTKPA